MPPESANARLRVAVLGVKYFPSKGGTSRVVEDLLEALSDRYDFTLYCYRDPRARGHLPGVETVELPEFPGGSIGVFLYYLWCALHLLWRGGVDVVHVHKIDAAPTLPLLLLRFACVATSHESPYRRDKWGRVARAYFKFAEQRFLRSGARISCVSASLAESYRKRRDGPVEFIPNGLRPLLECDDAAAEALLEERNVEDGFVLFAARRVMSTKGAHTLLEAAARKAGPPVLLIGDFDQLPEYTERLRALAEPVVAAGSAVHFVDPVDRGTLMALLGRATLFVFPSEAEGMSIMLLEAARMGAPMIASDIPENTSVLAPDEAVFFETGNADDLARCLAWARAHPAELKTRTERARRRVESDFGIESVAQRYAALYDAAAGRA